MMQCPRDILNIKKYIYRTKKKVNSKHIDQMCLIKIDEKNAYRIDFLRSTHIIE